MNAHAPRACGLIETKKVLMGIAIAAAVMAPCWTLTAAGPAPVNLGSTAHFTILAGAAVTTTGGGIINGDVGASPIAGSAILLNQSQVHGTIYAVDASGPAGSVVDPALLTAAKGDMTIAYNDAAGRTPIPTGDFLNPQGGNLGGLNLVPGLYKFTSTALITGKNVTLTGGPDDVWIFQITADLQVGSGIKVILAGGARAQNIFWQVGTSATIETSAVFKGTILADQAITMKTSSTMEGRALAFSAGVTFNGTGSSVPDSTWKKQIAEFQKMMKQRISYHYNLQHMENVEFRKPLKGLTFVVRVPLMVAHMNTQFSENQVFRTEQYSLRKDFVDRLMGESGVVEETQTQVRAMVDSLHQNALNHWDTQHNENVTILNHLVADTVLSAKERSAALRAHYAQQRAENRQFQYDRKVQWKAFWGTFKSSLKTAAWMAVFMEDSSKEEKETNSDLSTAGSGGCK